MLAVYQPDFEYIIAFVLLYMLSVGAIYLLLSKRQKKPVVEINFAQGQLLSSALKQNENKPWKSCALSITKGGYLSIQLTWPDDVRGVETEG